MGEVVDSDIWYAKQQELIPHKCISAVCLEAEQSVTQQKCLTGSWGIPTLKCLCNNICAGKIRIGCAGEEVKEEASEPVADAHVDEALPAENEGTVEAEDEEELSEEEKGRRIAAQWTHDPEATSQPDISKVGLLHHRFNKQSALHHTPSTAWQLPAVKRVILQKQCRRVVYASLAHLHS